MKSKSLSEAVSVSDPVASPAEGFIIFEPFWRHWQGLLTPGSGERGLLSVCRGGAETERMNPLFLKEANMKYV